MKAADLAAALATLGDHDITITIPNNGRVCVTTTAPPPNDLTVVVEQNYQPIDTDWKGRPTRGYPVATPTWSVRIDTDTRLECRGVTERTGPDERWNWGKS